MMVEAVGVAVASTAVEGVVVMVVDGGG